MDDELECQDCGWIGTEAELVCSKEDDKSNKSINEIAFNCCPDCDNTNIDNLD